jgi:hypothetical protein
MLEHQKQQVIEAQRAISDACRGFPTGVALDALNMTTAGLIVDYIDENARPNLLRQIDRTLRDRVVEIARKLGGTGPVGLTQ